MSVSHNNLSWTTQSKGTSSTTHALSYCWVYYAQSRVLPLRLLQHCDPAHSRAALHPVACSMPDTHTFNSQISTHRQQKLSQHMKHFTTAQGLPR